MSLNEWLDGYQEEIIFLLRTIFWLPWKKFRPRTATVSIRLPHTMPRRPYPSDHIVHTRCQRVTDVGLGSFAARLTSKTSPVCCVAFTAPSAFVVDLRPFSSPWGPRVTVPDSSSSSTMARARQATALPPTLGPDGEAAPGRPSAVAPTPMTMPTTTGAPRPRAPGMTVP